MPPAAKRFLTIVIGTTGLSCVLGVAVDLITANVAVDYFTVHHPRIVETSNPWILAVVWGIVASWWFGAIAGAVIATINHRRPDPLTPGRILRWMGTACGILWLIMMTILVGVLIAASTIPVRIRPPTFEHDRRLMAVAMAHQYEYVLGGAALLVISVMTHRFRIRPDTLRH